MNTLRALALLTASLASSSALAQGPELVTVQVEVTGRAAERADARVTLRPREGAGASHDCQTRNGSCTLRGVPPGQYVVTAEPTAEGRPPLPRVVPVPEGVGSVEVRVRLL